VCELGTGNVQTGFVPLGAGDNLPIVLGDVGRPAISVSARFDHLVLPADPTELLPIRAGLRHDGRDIAGALLNARPTSVSAEFAEFTGLQMNLDLGWSEVMPVGESVQLYLTATDACRREVHTSVSLQLGEAPKYWD